MRTLKVSEPSQSSVRSEDQDPDLGIPFDPGSYRDRTGRVLCLENRIFRLLDQAGGEHWKRLAAALFQAKKLADRVGGIRNAQELLNLLEQLR